MTSGTSQQFCVRWNSHLGSLGAAFPQLLAGQRFVDVTLACEGHQLHCHRLVLAACSTYFESLLGENPCKHPIIILPHDIKLWEIQALVDFMYKGEVNVSQAGLSDLLKCAEILQIRGLCGSEAGVNMNQANPTTTITDGTTSTASASTTASSTAGTTTNNQSNTIPNLITNPLSINSQNSNNNDRSENDSPTNHNPIQQEISSAVLSASSTSAIINNSSIGNVNSSRKSSIHQQQSHSNDSSQLRKLKIEQQLYRTSPNRSVQKIEPVDVSMDDDLDDDDSVNPAMDKTDDDSISGKYLDYLEATKSEFPLANVICEYDSGSLQISMDNVPGRRVRRSETLLRQAAECVSRGQTFQTVSDMFNIPISTIRFFMARKGILPRRKRGRSAGVSMLGGSHNTSSNDAHCLSNDRGTHSRSASPSEPPFHFATYKLPELKPKLG